jgi:hypothetical protein
MFSYNKTLLFSAILAVATILFFTNSTIPASAQTIPPYINYQGRLVDQASGAPVNGTKSITFSLYDSATGGTPIYSQTQQVTITNGTFSVYLGKGDKGEGNYQGNKVSDGIPSEVFTEHSARYLGIKIADSSTEMTPRQLIASVTYAYKADNATNADHATTAEDAHTVDGKHASEFLDTSDSTQTKSGSLNISGNLEAAGTAKATKFVGDGSGITGLSTKGFFWNNNDFAYINSNVNCNHTPRTANQLCQEAGFTSAVYAKGVLPF